MSNHGDLRDVAVVLKMLSPTKSQKQIGALPYRKRGRAIEVLLITSRETKRWVIPKGWPMQGKQDWDAAAIEAFEEAGLDGEIGNKSIGTYHYVKRKKFGDIDCEVTVYPMEVTNLLRDWPEKQERRRKWFKARDAAKKVDEEGLRAIIQASLA